MKVFKKIKSAISSIIVYNIFRYWTFLNIISPKIRPFLLRINGAKIGKGVYFSGGVYIDNNLKYLEIQDDVLVSPNAMFLFHKRDLRNYKIGDKLKSKPHMKSKTVIKEGAFIGMGAIIMPGVIIGKGAGVAAGAVVTKNVEDWTIVAGNPAVVLKKIEERKDV